VRSRAMISTMFLPSDSALQHLCNALNALRAPEELLESYGLIGPNQYLDYDEDVPHHVKPSSEELERELDQARSEKSEQLRNLCSELLRRRSDEDWNALDWADRVRFRDSMAQFEARLCDDGYTFDGFKIRGSKPVPSVAQRADEFLSDALRSGKFPRGEEIRDHLSTAVRLFNDDNYDESLTNLRLALQQSLEGIAGQLAEHQGGPRRSFKEDRDVRQYLEEIGLFSREEKKGFDGIYGLLSAGPHGKGDKDSTLLAYAACIMACHYAISKFQAFQDKKAP
jgi:hypothetical protein